MNATPLIIPPACLKAHVVVLGKTGAGKSSALRHMAEHLLAHEKRVCIIDPKGDWWGMTSSADGRSEGFHVLMFGDFKSGRSDVPMNDRAGKTVGEIVATTKQACVLGFRGWMPGALTRFWIDFASTLFNHNRGELFLFIDEVHNFAAKGKIMDPEAGKCLHWTNRLASEGRGLNIKLLIASQRPQKVHNDTLTSCETLVAMRVIHEADREAIKSWIDGCGDKEQGKKVLAELAQMKRGEAWVWSPEAGYLERTKFPMFTTFDSFSDHATTAPKKWAVVDVEGVKAKLATVVEEAKANDPRELRAKNKELEQELYQVRAALKKYADAEPEQAKQVPVLTDDEFEQVCDIRRQIERATEALTDSKIHVATLMDKLASFNAPLPPATLTKHVFEHGKPGPVRVIPPRPTNGSAPSSLPEGERLILIAVAQTAGGASRDQIGLLTGYKRSTRNAYIQRLDGKGLVQVQGEQIIATQEGVNALGSDYRRLPTGSALLAHWMGELPEGEARILAVAADTYPSEVDREYVGKATEYKRSTRNAYIQRLEARKLVISRGSSIRAADELFD